MFEESAFTIEEPSITRDIKVISSVLMGLPTNWDGKKCVLELKESNYQWRQMEWWAWYFEFKAKNLLKDVMKVPGDKYGNVIFDIRGAINWDFKASAIKTDNHKIILNDKVAMDKSIDKDGAHGEIIALCDVEYNDVNRTFQKWHTHLKGGKSQYELNRESRTSISRYRKTKAVLTEILILTLGKGDVKTLPIMRQGRNSDGSARKVKYMLDLEDISGFNYKKVKMEND